MKKITLLMVLFTFVCLGIQAKDHKKLLEYRYELSLDIPNVAATSGFKVFKVWSYAKKREALAKVSKDICMRNAIHGLLFKGLAASDEGTQGSVPALVPDGYKTHKEYFDHFFDSKEYMQFIQLTSRGAQQAGDIIKTANKEYKVGLLVQVNLNALRKRLEKDGIINSAQSIFKY